MLRDSGATEPGCGRVSWLQAQLSQGKRYCLHSTLALPSGAEGSRASLILPSLSFPTRDPSSEPRSAPLRAVAQAGRDAAARDSDSGRSFLATSCFLRATELSRCSSACGALWPVSRDSATVEVALCVQTAHQVPLKPLALQVGSGEMGSAQLLPFPGGSHSPPPLT